uniref:Mitochondrial carrier protein n=1 Tax=Florenciella parvula TaxID=236787 RepID=A0A7S2BD50_9STRA|mmetsp:Transcript_15483/g.32377  ORF Transcript_15483/g.32377 Transcript_15483/m.32377 type:complete len:334 (+) Transcript_15483:161-1162(+)|eukprot:CAMPEP_0182546194 /NCGR_PEP_ID=MMETSP1323-20130603/35652_1 /TAXON_ID=236787 /ORGANISM="Florenciella parvula, Strain RCC1693" /LENGTH=333 /DNA_ID=CAMNT_0024757393 /DNA_START=147 /DNA_END=1148 /DNA_ORIENTATION=-
MAGGEFLLNLGAMGASSGLSMAFLNPLDTLRLRWQVASSSSAGAGLFPFGRRIVALEGAFRGLVRPGLGANVLSVGACNALKYASYPVIRDALSTTHDGEAEDGVGAMVAASMMSGAMGYAFFAPLYLTKTKLQTLLGTVGPDGRYLDGPRRGHLPAHRSLAQSLGASFREASVALRTASHGGRYGGAHGGAIATLRSLCALWDCGGTTLLVLRGAAISCGQLTFYDLTKRESKRHGVEEGPLLHMGASVVAAFWATTLSLPFDVLLAKWSIASKKEKEQGAWGVARRTLAREGPRILVRGWVPMFSRLTPLYIAGSTIFEQIRIACGVGYYA